VDNGTIDNGTMDKSSMDTNISLKPDARGCVRGKPRGELGDEVDILNLLELSFLYREELKKMGATTGTYGLSFQSICLHGV